MPSTSEILTLAPPSSYLATNALAKGQLFPKNKLNPILPQQIYAAYFVLNKIYTLDPAYPGIDACAQYLWELMGKYGVEAQAITGGGGNVPTPTLTQQFPIYITQDNFTTATLYPNTNLFGNNIAVFLNEFQRYLDPATEFEVLTTGLNITASGFDALSFTYTLVIEKVYS